MTAKKRMKLDADVPKDLADKPYKTLTSVRKEHEAIRRTIEEGPDAMVARMAKHDDDVASIIQSRIDDLKPGKDKIKLGTFKRADGRRFNLSTEYGSMTGKPKKSLTRAAAEEYVAQLRSGALEQSRREAYGRLPELLANNEAIEATLTASVKGKGGFVDDLRQQAQGMIGGYVAGQVAGGDASAGMLGMAMLSPKAARFVSNLVTKRMSGAIQETSERAANAVNALMGAAKKVTGPIPKASAVLGAVSFGEEPPKKTRGLEKSYTARSKEVLSHVTAGPAGKPVMKMASRQKVADRLTGVRAVDPLLADRIETMAARRLEFLADKLPKRPDVAGSMWRPSDLQIRQWARYVAATEDPMGVVERAASGSISPEDAEALRSVYPEQHADIVRQVVEKLPELRDKLTGMQRLSLSILTGVPVEPALDPRVLRQLQSSFTFEPGSAGGTQAPTPSPQFGSVTKPSATPAQNRAAGEQTA